jgi:tetratricopeptide (TPR) repeat protein
MRSLGKYGICILALAVSPLALGQNTAKVALEDGTPLPTTPLIVPGFTARAVPACRIVEVFGNGTVEYYVTRFDRGFCHGLDCLDNSATDACPVRISLPGYRTTDATLHQGAVIVLKRLGDHEGSTISITVLNAPKDARKAYESGVAEMSRKKWDSAQQKFEKAVALYPAYAPAWSDLGEVFMRESRPQEARTACERALQADSKYLRPYLQLARLALAEKRMQDAVNITGRAMDLDPVEFPGLFFYAAVANYNLRHLDVAERCARRTIELDPHHEIPVAESLLGSVLAAKGDRRGAIEHLTKYLEISPKASDAAQVRERIATLEQGSTGSQ